ncbi:unnamed protein product [Periconia digitata]|uniref:Uncharacterized protein n=1 Tax=Periconia digitata TaxID=1303443 RepID=A0A9W4XTZ1_9PLEO|nr:unnamed protein product [Periconia digitata]
MQFQFPNTRPTACSRDENKMRSIKLRMIGVRSSSSSPSYFLPNDLVFLGSGIGRSSTWHKQTLIFFAVVASRAVSAWPHWPG